MPDGQQRIYSLSAVARAIENALKEPAKTTFWVQAEVTSPRTVGGHLYAMLVELRDGEPIARMHCVIWQSTLRQIKASFAASGLDFELVQGMKVCLQCRISFHAVHGLSLSVLNADPRFVLGELELRKRQLIELLSREGADALNKRHAAPALPLRLGLVTSREGDAYIDIVQNLQGAGYRFTVLFAESIMQGENAGRSILRAMDALESLSPDVIIIARGGGNRTDLAWLDSEPLARRVAACGVPVWTGIGHMNDRGVLDAVAHSAFETPTAVAKAIIARFDAASNFAQHAKSLLGREWHHRLTNERSEMEDNAVGLRQGTRKLAGQARTSLVERSERFEIVVERRLSDMQQKNQLGTQRLRMRSEQMMHARLTLLPTLSLRTRMAARRMHASAANRCASSRSRLDAGRVLAIVEGRRSVAIRQYARLSRGSSFALTFHEGKSDRMKDRLLHGSWMVRFQSAAVRLADQLRLVLAQDPRKALERGYAIVTGRDERIVTSVRMLEAGDDVRIAFRDGSAESSIVSIRSDEAPGRGEYS